MGIKYSESATRQPSKMPKCTKNWTLLDVGTRVIDSISQTFDHTSCSLSLSDKSGYVIYNDTTTGQHHFHNDKTVGRCFNESAAGTTSIALALHLKQDIAIVGHEHFRQEFEKNFCSTALIRDAHDDVLGTLTVSHPISAFNDFSHSLAVITARMIEGEIHKSYYTSILDASLSTETGTNIVLLDKNFQIIQASQAFLNLLGISPQKAQNLDFKNVFQGTVIDELFDNDNTFIEKELCLKSLGKDTQMLANIVPISSGDRIDTLALFFQNAKPLFSFKKNGSIKNSQNKFHHEEIITESPKMKSLIQDCSSVADLDLPVLLEGETGVGKELFARLIYRKSKRCDGPFIAVNCAALPPNLVESELFGYEKGAFTGGLPNGKAGKFEMADGGVIFLDEIGELCLDFQAKLLRVLDNNECARIGGVEKPLNIRVIAATNRNLQKEVENSNFRSDLYYRLSVLSFDIPPLRERDDDILLLARTFLSRLNNDNMPDPPKKLSKEVENTLSLFNWKGNVRELQNVLQRAFYLCKDETITNKHLPEYIQEYSVPAFQNNIEYRTIYDALVKAHGKVAIASDILNMPLSTLYRKISHYQINVKEIVYK